MLGFILEVIVRLAFVIFLLQIWTDLVTLGAQSIYAFRYMLAAMYLILGFVVFHFWSACLLWFKPEDQDQTSNK